MPTAYILESDYTNFNASIGNFTGTPPAFIFSYGSAIFVAIRRFSTSTSNTLTIYKTTNGGISFTKYNGPVTGNNDYTLALDGTTLYCLYLNHAGGESSVSFFTFDLLTLTFSSVVTGGPVAGPNSNSMGLAAYNGNLTFFYYRVIAATPNLFYSTYSAGWSVETFVETMASNGFRGIIVNPANGNIGLAYLKFGPFRTRFRSFVAGVLSSPVDETTQLSNDYGNRPGIYNAAEDSWMIPSTDSFNTGIVTIFSASPSVNPTTITIETVATPPGGKTYRQASIVLENSNITAIFERYDSGNLVDLILATSRAASGGAWSSPVTIFDRTLDTFVPIPSGAGADQSVDFLPLDSDTFAFSAFNPGTTRNEYLVTSVLPLELECPVLLTFTSNTSFSTTPIFSGGVLPYTFSATGLPDGVSINASTGTISGQVVLPGTYEFTITITDANDDTLTVECAIVIVQCPSGQAFVGG